MVGAQEVMEDIPCWKKDAVGPGCSSPLQTSRCRYLETRKMTNHGMVRVEHDRGAFVRAILIWEADKFCVVSLSELFNRLSKPYFQFRELFISSNCV